MNLLRSKLRGILFRLMLPFCTVCWCPRVGDTNSWGIGGLCHSDSDGFGGGQGARNRYQPDVFNVGDKIECVLWDPLESTCRHASLSIL